MLYLSHARGGSGGWGFLGRFSDFWGVFGGRIRYSVVLWIVGGRAGVLFRACGRAGVRGYAPPIFCARPIPAGLPSHSVRRICGGVSSVWCECECRVSVFIA